MTNRVSRDRDEREMIKKRKTGNREKGRFQEVRHIESAVTAELYIGGSCFSDWSILSTEHLSSHSGWVEFLDMPERF